MNFLSIFITAVLIENVVLVKFLGICPFLGVSKNTTTAFGMGVSVIFVITVSSIITWAINTYLLIPFDLVYLQTIVFILVIASLVQLVEMFLQKTLPSLYKGLGIYLPLITTNCAVLGVCLLASQKTYSFEETIIYAVGSSIGFLVAIFIMAGIRERLEESNVPEFMKGLPISLISAGLIAMAFTMFSGFRI
ncbi:electron transport complex protein RnfA [Treponema sp. R6D11]